MASTEPLTAFQAQLSTRPGPIQRVRNVWRYRELLVNLIRKELKVKYKNSVLGFAWSLLNPALYLVVFSLVFQVFLRAGIPYFGIFLLAGLLPWNLFATGLSASTGAVVGNANLVQKVWFPREVLVVAAIGAAMVHFVLQLTVLGLGLLVFTYEPAWGYLWMLVPALATLLLFLAGAGLLLAAANVYLRDTQHLLELALVAWFWVTPIVYAYRFVADQLQYGYLLLLNPLTSVVLTFQRVIYNRVEHVAPDGSVTAILPPDAGIGWYLRNLGLVAAGSVALLVVALWLFGRLEDDFAEEI